MKIQTMSLHDLECIKPILIEQFDDFWNFNILEQNFNNINSIYFVAKSEEGDSFGEKKNEPDTILGFVGLLDTPIDIEVSNIVVRKDYRNFGIGQQLLNQTFEYASSKGKNLITLEVNENNHKAYSLYLKNGFIEIRRRKNYYNNIEDAIFMQKELR